jgi:hypothetical protein
VNTEPAMLVLGLALRTINRGLGLGLESPGLGLKGPGLVLGLTTCGLVNIVLILLCCCI